MARKFNSDDFSDDQTFERKPRTESRPKRRFNNDEAGSSKPKRLFKDKPYKPKRSFDDDGENFSRGKRSFKKTGYDNDRPNAVSTTKTSVRDALSATARKTTVRANAT